MSKIDLRAYYSAAKGPHQEVLRDYLLQLDMRDVVQDLKPWAAGQKELPQEALLIVDAWARGMMGRTMEGKVFRKGEAKPVIKQAKPAAVATFTSVAPDETRLTLDEVADPDTLFGRNGHANTLGGIIKGKRDFLYEGHGHFTGKDGMERNLAHPKTRRDLEGKKETTLAKIGKLAGLG